MRLSFQRPSGQVFSDVALVRFDDLTVVLVLLHLP